MSVFFFFPEKKRTKSIINRCSPLDSKLSIRSTASCLFILHSRHSTPPPPLGITELLMCQKQSDFFSPWCVLPVLSTGHRGLRAQISGIKEDICRDSWMGFGGQGDTGGLSERSVVWGKRKSLLFFLSPTEPCGMNFTESEGNIEILQPLDSGVECSYLITVYLGYGIEVQVSIMYSLSF